MEKLIKELQIKIVEVKDTTEAIHAVSVGKGDAMFDLMPVVNYLMNQLQITNPDGTRTFVAIHLEARRLYILEGTVPQEAPPPGMFQQSLGILDENGRRIRYVYDDNDNKIRVDTGYQWTRTEE